MQTEAELLAGAKVASNAPALTEDQQKLLNDKLAKAAARAAAKAKQPDDPTGDETPTGDAVYTAQVAALPLVVAHKEAAFLVEPRTLAQYAGLSDSTLKADAAFIALVDVWKSERQKLNGLRNVDDAESVTFAELCKRRDEATQLELILAQDAVRLCRLYVERLQARLPELRDYATKQAAKFVEVEASVTKRLNGVGVSVETQRSWPHAPQSAEIQFRHVIERAADWQEQQSEASKADAQVQITADFIPSGRLRIGEAEKSLRQKVAKLVA